MQEGERLDAELERLRGQTVHGRDWLLMRKLGAISAALLVGGLLVDILLGAPELAWLPFSGGVAVGAVMFMYAFNKRLFVTKPPVK